MNCAQCGGKLVQLTDERPEGRHGKAERADYRCPDCRVGGAVVSRRGDVVRRVGPTFEEEV